MMAKEPECTTCDGTGWCYVTGKRAVEKCQECLERKRGFAPGVPEDEQTTLLGSWGEKFKLTNDNALALQQARFFVQDVHPGLYLYGDVGTGKTALACAVLNELHKTGQRVRFVRVSELLKMLVQSETGDQVYDRMMAVPVLCLDDIGAQKGSDYARQMLVSIADGRTDRGHRTLWTSNLNLDSLATFLGDDERLSSRIAGNAKVVAMDGDDYRFMKARQRA